MAKFAGLMALLTAAPFLCERFDCLIRWLKKRYQVAVEEGCEYPPFRFIGWLRVTHRDSGYDHDLLVIKLPSYEWGLWYRYDRYGWLQWILIWRGPFVRREWQGRGGWSMHLAEVW